MPSRRQKKSRVPSMSTNSYPATIASQRAGLQRQYFSFCHAKATYYFIIIQIQLYPYHPPIHHTHPYSLLPLPSLIKPPKGTDYNRQKLKTMSDSGQEGSKHKPINYGQHHYWDQRYAKSEGERFEWLQTYQNLQAGDITIQAQIQKTVNFDKQTRILHLGCGNSAVQDHLYEAGYHKITNVDISGVVIAQMNKIKAERGYSQMVFEVQDVRKLPYDDSSFDLAIDKSTIDSLMCTDNPLTNVAAMIDQTYRVLTPNGIYFVLSYGSPASRMEHITRLHVNWEVEKKEISRMNEEGQKLVHYLYICRKVPLPQERKSKEWREAYFQQLKELEAKEYPL